MTARLTSPLPLTYSEARGLKPARIVRTGVRIAVIDSQNCILFVNHPKKGWELPGGALDPREHPAEAALRELEEESGLVLAKRPLETAGFLPVEVINGSHWLDIVFVVRVREAEKVFVNSAEFPIKWLSAPIIAKLPLRDDNQRLLQMLLTR